MASEKVEKEGVVISDQVTDRNSKIKLTGRKKGQISIIGLMCNDQIMLFNCYITFHL